MKQKLIYIFRILYILWTFFWIYTILEKISYEKIENSTNIINTIFLCYGIYYMFKYHSK